MPLPNTARTARLARVTRRVLTLSAALAAACSAAERASPVPGDGGANEAGASAMTSPPITSDAGHPVSTHDAGASTPEASAGDSSLAPDAGVTAERDASTDRSMTDGASGESTRDASPDSQEGSAASDGGIAATPPVGWNSWNTFQCNISESLVEATADAMVSSGMRDAGFEFVNLDDCWMHGRDASGNLQWDTAKFPSGIPALAQYVHAKGLKLGIYETPNTITCVGLYGGVSHSVAVGSLGHEAQDARTFASWGIDYLKYDLCQGQLSSFAVMRDALRATGRPIVYSINPGNGSGCPPTGPTTSTCGLNLPATANLWRIAFDINASWSSITGLIDQDAPLSAFAGPGHWNDPDMLEVGNGTLSDDENKAHFSMWAVLAAPLLAGNDLRSMSAATKAILTNSEVIAVDQDPLGAQGDLVATPQTGLQVWSKRLTGGNVRAVALLNRTGSPASITVTFSQLGLTGSSAAVRDLWQHTDLGTFDREYTAPAVPSHGVALLRISE